MKNARMRTTRTAHTTRATRSQCPVKRVPASLRTLVSVLAAVCVDADPRFIAVLLVRSSRAYRDQLAFDFHYTATVAMCTSFSFGVHFGSVWPCDLDLRYSCLKTKQQA